MLFRSASAALAIRKFTSAGGVVTEAKGRAFDRSLLRKGFTFFSSTTLGNMALDRLSVSLSSASTSMSAQLALGICIGGALASIRAASAADSLGQTSTSGFEAVALQSLIAPGLS